MAGAAELPEMVLPVMTMKPLLLLRMPPPPIELLVEVLPETVESVSVKPPLLLLLIPPPFWAVLVDTLLPVTVAVPTELLLILPVPILPSPTEAQQTVLRPEDLLGGRLWLHGREGRSAPSVCFMACSICPLPSAPRIAKRRSFKPPIPEPCLPESSSRSRALSASPRSSAVSEETARP